MKTIFFDIDGTLVDIMRGLPDPSPLTMKAFRKMKEEHRTIIASGRSLGMLPDKVKELDPSGYLLMNGAYFQLNGEDLFSYVFKEEEIEDIVAFFDDHEGIIFLETKSDVIFCNGIGTDLFRNMLEGFEDHSVYLELEERDQEEVNMISVYFEKEETGKLFVQQFKDAFDITRQFADLPYYDANIPGINKGTAIRKYLEKEGIKKEDCFAFGDSFNDLQMMEEVGTAIAMGNSVEELKLLADDVTKDVLDEGVYHALVKYGLIDEIREEK
ncbi:MAG: Cof-type HAD-IIB family hydrolase [Erysipelotrichaceae bacterium]|nr:Cof-type HAD-IIB family hydrolase [Erysipelotrichaceae bacterium]